ncbi:MAG: hypothetical protein AAGI17_05295 [Planctomycetota bacterium]
MQGAAGTRCVIWHPDEIKPPARLLEALRRRGIEPIATSASYIALAHLARIHRDESCEVVIALMLEPDRLERPIELLQAMELYTPRAVAWVYREDVHPQLRAVTDDDREQFKENGRRQGGGPPPTDMLGLASASGQFPNLRLVNGGESEYHTPDSSEEDEEGPMEPNGAGRHDRDFDHDDFDR